MSLALAWNLERVIEISILLADCWLFFPGDKNTALSFQKVYNLFDKKELRLRMLGQNNCNAFSKVKNYDLWVWYPLAVSEPLLKERQIVKYILPLTTDQSSFSQNNQESAKFISTTTLSTLNKQMTKCSSPQVARGGLQWKKRKTNKYKNYNYEQLDAL